MQRFIPFFFPVLIFGVIGSCSIRKAKDVQGAVITKFSGTVILKKSNQGSYELKNEMLGKKDSVLTDGDILSTASDSQANLQFSTGISMTIGESTSIKIEKTRVLTGKNYSKVLIYLVKGSIYTQTPVLSPESRIEIASPASVALVRGTKFLAKTTQAGSEILVSKGTVQVFSGNGENQKNVQEGFKTSANQKGLSELKLDEKDNLELNSMIQFSKPESVLNTSALSEFLQSEDQKNKSADALKDYEDEHLNRNKKPLLIQKEPASPVEKNKPERIRDPAGLGRTE